MEDKEYRNRLHERLIKLADMMETAVDDPPFHKELSKEYKSVMLALYPDAYKNHKKVLKDLHGVSGGMPKLRKPSQAFIRTLVKCKCGQSSKFTLKRNENIKLSLECPACGYNTGDFGTISLARDEWNKHNFKK